MLRQTHQQFKVAVPGYISGQGLCEVFAVLTRTPFTPPIYPMGAWKLLSINGLLTTEMYRETIQECADHGWIGGGIDDALHLCRAKKAAYGRIHAFSLRRFQQLADAIRHFASRAVKLFIGFLSTPGFFTERSDQVARIFLLFDLFCFGHRTMRGTSSRFPAHASRFEGRSRAHSR
jgi:hypothetical protein